MIFFTILNMLIFFYDTRFRLHLIPFLIIFGAIGLIKIVEVIVSNKFFMLLKKARMYVFLSALIITGIILWADSKVIKTDFHMYNSLGEIYLAKNQLEKAKEAFEKALEVKKDFRALFGISKVFFAQGYKNISADIYHNSFSILPKTLHKFILRDKDYDDIRDYINQRKMKGR